MKVRDLMTQHWLSQNVKAADIVMSSRVRLARNLIHYPFPSMANEKNKIEIEEKIINVFSNVQTNDPLYLFQLQNLTDVERDFLMERHVLSQEHAHGDGCRSLVIGTEEKFSLMINEEDHIRLQVLYPSLDLVSCWKLANEMDNVLIEKLDIAYSPQKGFLTECPTNVGTGMRASAMLHLPGLVYLKKVSPVFDAITKLGLTVRGLYGEGSSALGHIYQISNQVTLGLSEEEIIQKLSSVVNQVISHERVAREYILSTNRIELEDRIYRSLGVLKSARLLSYTEAIDLLSTIWLGCGINLVSGLDETKIYELFYLVQPAHIQVLEGERLSPEQRDEKRARLVREQIKI